MGEFETVAIDGTTTRLYRAGDAEPGSAGVVVFHPWWGLNDDVVAYADRLAAAGFAVISPDLFGGQVASTIEEAEGLMRAADEAAVDAIARAAIDHLADRLGPTAKLAALGFSFGAHWAMWSPAERDRVAASVVYYGTTGGPILSQARVPVLGHFAENDPYEDDEGVAAFEDALRPPVVTSSSTDTQGSGTGSPSRLATPTGPMPRTSPSSGRWPSSNASWRRRRTELGAEAPPGRPAFVRLPTTLLRAPLDVAA